MRCSPPPSSSLTPGAPTLAPRAPGRSLTASRCGTSVRARPTPRSASCWPTSARPMPPTPSAVRRYLAQFLTDPRVIEIPAVGVEADPLRRDPVRAAGAVGEEVRRRSGRRTARRCSCTACGSGRCCWATSASGSRRPGYPADLCPVEIGMNYGNPSMGSAIDKLRAANCEKILVLPLFPQYSASATASTFDAVAAHLYHARRVPALRFVETFHADDGYIKALAQNVNDFWMKNGRPDKLVMSFHGVPRRTLELGDPYHCFCQVTGAAARARAGAVRRPVGADVPVALRQGAVAQAVHGGRAEVARAGRARGGSTCSARASSPTASRRSRKSAWRAARRTSRPAARSST